MRTTLLARAESVAPRPSKLQTKRARTAKVRMGLLRAAFEFADGAARRSIHRGAVCARGLLLQAADVLHQAVDLGRGQLVLEGLHLGVLLALGDDLANLVVRVLRLPLGGGD